MNIRTGRRLPPCFCRKKWSAPRKLFRGVGFCPSSVLSRSSLQSRGKEGAGLRRRIFLPFGDRTDNPSVMLCVPTPFAQGSQGVAGAVSRPYKPPTFGKGRCHEVTEGIRVNPQKGRHLLCTFCPYEMRSMSRKGRELCPNGAKREGKPRFSGAELRAYAVVSPLNLSASHSLHFFIEKM